MNKQAIKKQTAIEIANFITKMHNNTDYAKITKDFGEKCAQMVKDIFAMQVRAIHDNYEIK